MADRSALHQARLLENRLRRLDSRRRNQRDAADSAFFADLRALWGEQPAWKREMVRSALRVDQDNAYLFAECERAERELDPAERTEPPPPLQLTAGDAGGRGHPMEPTDLGGVELARVPPPPIMPRPGVAAAVRAAPAASPGPSISEMVEELAAHELVPKVEHVAFDPAVPVQAADYVVDANGVRHDGLRYPEPGEPARLLADGVTAVMDEQALRALEPAGNP